MLEGTTYQVNDVYLFLKDNCKFPAMANVWMKTYAGFGSIPGTGVLGWLKHQLPEEVAEHYFRLMQTVCTGQIEFETSIDIDKIAITITDMLDNEGIDLIQSYDLELNDREIGLDTIDLNKRVVKNIIVEVLKQKLNK